MLTTTNILAGYLPFGKHRFVELEEVPSAYLRWVLREVSDLSEELRQEVVWILRERTEAYTKGESKPSQGDKQNGRAVGDLVKVWYRDLALTHHPDRGGSDEAMKAVNDAHDRLKRALGL